ncbi:MAG: threonine synthase [Actinomycetia bacterium]|nr:threonine synthase [Actinomycetes bacterium]
MTTRYIDTRGLDDTRPTFTEAVVKGIAPGGGLYVPEALPSLAPENLLALWEVPYAERAARVFELFGVDVAPQRIRELMAQAYGAQWDDERIAPVEEVVPGLHVLELWHGPTSAFKDMALQCMPLFFSEAISMQQARGTLHDDFLVLVATSGDTGKAALEGFADRAHTRIAVFYPSGGVSDIQRKQMVTQRGDNVAVFGVRGNFDDCQNAVKAAFNDADFNRRLHDRYSLRLSSANSINWGRLLPQIAYYASAYVDMVAAGGVVAGEPIDVCVPTGNFGNILGAYYAKHMGVPIERLLCASNTNKVLSDFIASGAYDISSREFVMTPSPSMDILISSNLERLLYHLAGPEAVRQWMASLAEQGRFRVDRETFTSLRGCMSGDWVDNDESLATIRRVFAETGYLMDPHTAVAWEVAERLRSSNPVLVVSTAHWAKFGADVCRALTGVAYDEELPAEYRSLTGVQLLERIAAFAGGDAYIPRGLAELDALPERFGHVVDAGRDGVEGAVQRWLDS